MTRHPDWSTRMADFIAGAKDAVFGWGGEGPSTFDCATLPAALGIYMGCPDFLEGLRGYSTALGAASTLQNAGYASVRHMAEARLEARLLPTLGQRGDVALIENEGREGIWQYALGVFDGRFVLTIGPEQAGLIWVPRSFAIKAFRMG